MHRARESSFRRPSPTTGAATSRASGLEQRFYMPAAEARMIPQTLVARPSSQSAGPIFPEIQTFPMDRANASDLATPAIQRMTSWVMRPVDPCVLPVQRAVTGDGNLGQRIRAAAGGGSSLDASTQQRLEAGLGADLSGVRVHTDGEADRLSRSVSAAAFTTGPNIFFRSGTYNPSSSKGLQLLAHEATHVIQQASGPVAGTPAPGGVSISNPGDSFEQAAASAAARVLASPSSTTQRSIEEGRRAETLED